MKHSRHFVCILYVRNVVFASLASRNLNLRLLLSTISKYYSLVKWNAFFGRTSHFNYSIFLTHGNHTPPFVHLFVTCALILYFKYSFAFLFLWLHYNFLELWSRLRYSRRSALRRRWNCPAKAILPPPPSLPQSKPTEILKIRGRQAYPWNKVINRSYYWISNLRQLHYITVGQKEEARQDL